MNNKGTAWSCEVCGWLNTNAFCIQCGTPNRERKQGNTSAITVTRKFTPSERRPGNKKALVSNILAELKKNFIINSVYFSESSEKARTKINAALESYGGGIDKNEIVLGCQDDTLFGSSDTGCLFTTHSIYVKPMFLDLYSIRYQDIKKISFKENEVDVCIDDKKISAVMVGKEQIGKFCEMIKFLCNRLGNIKSFDNAPSKFCENCGAKVLENTKFCTSCGTRIV